MHRTRLLGSVPSPLLLLLALIGAPPCFADETPTPTTPPLETTSGLIVYVRNQNAALRSQPNFDGHLIDRPSYGSALRQINVRGLWYEVQAETTGNKGWVHKQDVGFENPILPAGYGRVVWGQGNDEVAAATGAVAEGSRLVETRAEGSVEAVAYNFREGGLWYVEERYRVLPGRTLEDFVERASERFGAPHQDGTRRWSEKRGDSETMMEARYYRWETGPTGFALVSYGPIYDEGVLEVRAEYWSTDAARKAGLSGLGEALERLEFGGTQP